MPRYGIQLDWGHFSHVRLRRLDQILELPKDLEQLTRLVSEEGCERRRPLKGRRVLHRRTH